MQSQPDPRANGSFALFETAIGWCAIAWSANAVVGVQLPEANQAATRARMRWRYPALSEVSEPCEARIQAIIDRLRAALAGQADTLADVELDMHDTPAFYRQVYELARSIPYGQTLTYGEVARALGDPGAARAVGQALGKNPFAPIVPCHRVVAAQGKMGGFSAPGGTGTKRKMLLIEGGLKGHTIDLFAT